MTVTRPFRWFLGSVLLLVVLGSVAVWQRPVTFFDARAELHLLFSGAQSRFTTVAGYRIHYYALGPANGPTVILVHGLGGRSEDWENLAPSLADAGYRVYLPDLPGYGQSEQPAGFSYSIPDEAAVVVSFFDKLGLQQVNLGGWSMGGWITQRIAIDHPDRVQKLMLFDSAGLAVKPDWNTALFTPTSAGELAQLDDLLMPNPPRIPAFVAADILRGSRRNAWIIQRALASMLTGHDTTDQLLPTLKMPVLLVWGELDRITPVNEADTIHKLIPQSQLQIVAGCGHLAPRQCVPQIAPTVLAFLRLDVSS